MMHPIRRVREHAATMREDLRTRVTHARRSPTRSRTGPRTPADRAQVGAVRDWARTNGYTVSDRGRIPAAVQEAFDGAH